MRFRFKIRNRIIQSTPQILNKDITDGGNETSPWTKGGAQEEPNEYKQEVALGDISCAIKLMVQSPYNPTKKNLKKF